MRDRQVANPDSIYERLKQDIICQTIEPGEALIEEKIATRFGVSRTPVRQAFALLANTGLVSQRPHQGVVANPIRFRDIHDLYQVRTILEAGSAELAASRATEEECRKLRKLAQAGYRFRDRSTYERFIKNNFDFHVGIARLSGNEILARLIEPNLDMMHRIFWASLDIQDYNEEATDEHLELVAAISAHDPVRARTLTEQQMRNSEKRAISALIHSSGLQISV
ncbi:MAG: GntR family transcriptional regulator [Candidatus Acidiferrales bacterium]